MIKSLFLAIVVFTVGCEFIPPITSGEIIDRGYVPAWSEEVSIVVSEIQVGDISLPIYGTETVYHEEYWFFVIENENKKGEVVNRQITVSEDWYNRQKIDDWIKIQE